MMKPMKVIARALMALFAAFTALFFTNMLVISVFSLGPESEHLWIHSVISWMLAIAVAWFVWKKTAKTPHGLVSSIFLGALLLGGIGFVAGFAGPLILTPGSNLGPLLGILVTGPLGLVAGGFAGLAYWISRGWTRHNRRPTDSREETPL